MQTFSLFRTWVFEDVSIPTYKGRLISSFTRTNGNNAIFWFNKNNVINTHFLGGKTLISVLKTRVLLIRSEHRIN